MMSYAEGRRQESDLLLGVDGTLALMPKKKLVWIESVPLDISDVRCTVINFVETVSTKFNSTDYRKLER